MHVLIVVTKNVDQLGMWTKLDMRNVIVILVFVPQFETIAPNTQNAGQLESPGSN